MLKKIFAGIGIAIAASVAGFALYVHFNKDAAADWKEGVKEGESGIRGADGNLVKQPAKTTPDSNVK